MSIANFFNSPLNRRLIPNNASLDGPQPGDVQHYIDGKSGQIYQDSAQGPVPIESKHSAMAGNFNMNINAGALITGFNSAINQMYDHSRGIKEFSRLKRKQLQDTGYNPYMYGTGSSANFRNGGSVPAVPGGEYLSSQIYQFNGPSHENGGIPISYAGKQVEVEGGETAYRDNSGDLNIFGNLKIPGSNIKFKTAGKQIGKLEAILSKKLQKGENLMNAGDPVDKFGRLTYNSGMLIKKAAGQDQQVLNNLKERLSVLQERELSSSGINTGVKARSGAAIDGDPKKNLKPSMAARHNNPGNIKYNSYMNKRYGAVKGEKSTDGDYFSRFPDVQTGLQAMQGLLKGNGYKNLTVEKALRRWTSSLGYPGIDLKDLKDKVVGSLGDEDLKRVMNVITQGEDSKLYDLDYLYPTQPKDPHINVDIKRAERKIIPISHPDLPGTFTNIPPDTNVPKIPGRKKTPLPDIVDPGSPAKPGHPNPLSFFQYGPELFALGDRPDFVPGQRYEPNLYQPYQISFQDRLNQNQATFNNVAMQSGGHPSALGVLAAQKYMADSAVLADEFRTNQGITNDITNKNIGLLNDAQFKNLQLADTQFVRQAQAVANTRQNIFNAVNSLASKIGQNKLETRSYNAMSGMFPQYDFDDMGNQVYLPNNAQSFGTTTAADNSDNSYYQRTRNEYDGNGKLKKQMINTPSEAEQSRIDYQNWNNQLKKRMSLLQQSRRLKSTS
ncbi:hypothetical protein HGH93_21385 [Chitinophaga polysaccharea]|uniref:hypothetical protein n=1 Tax=Chitinophaga polysaccharea TaxID=1293035 RepID=UPI00145553D9|nr:hypothetical protein [Chitinophaga polysaccharea]NLR60677.1 hypothetical protein [Chitinophaga polysaccharea]